MSYTIERGKRVLSLKTDDKRFSPTMGDALFFVASSSCNNVSPRHYDWSVLATGHHRDWQGNVLVPSAIWRAGEAADGGEIKPWGKETSGLSYVKAWKDAVKHATPVDGWTPRVSVWFNDHDPATVHASAELFGGKYARFDKSYGEAMYAAFKRLFPTATRSGNQSEYADTPEKLLDALYLFMHRAELPFSIYLTDTEHSAFFAKKEAALAG